MGCWLRGLGQLMAECIRGLRFIFHAGSCSSSKGISREKYKEIPYQPKQTNKRTSKQTKITKQNKQTNKKIKKRMETNFQVNIQEISTLSNRIRRWRMTVRNFTCISRMQKPRESTPKSVATCGDAQNPAPSCNFSQMQIYSLKHMDFHEILFARNTSKIIQATSKGQIYTALMYEKTFGTHPTTKEKAQLAQPWCLAAVTHPFNQNEEALPYSVIHQAASKIPKNIFVVVYLVFYALLILVQSSEIFKQRSVFARTQQLLADYPRLQLQMTAFVGPNTGEVPRLLQAAPS